MDSRMGLVAEILIENEISQALIEKLGFCCEAVGMQVALLDEGGAEENTMLKIKRYTLKRDST